MRYYVFVALSLFSGNAWSQERLDPPVKNWPVAPYWVPPRDVAERLRQNYRSQSFGRTEVAVTVPEATSDPVSPLAFVAVTPCRLVDTRAASGFTGAFGPPSLTAQRTIPIPSNTKCNIPSSAAYSLNFTLVCTYGKVGFLSAWPDDAPFPSTSVLNGQLGGVIANATIIPAGADGGILVVASNPTDLLIDVNGYFVPASSGSLTLPFTGSAAVASTSSAVFSITNSATTGVDNAPNDAGAAILAQGYNLQPQSISGQANAGGIGLLTRGGRGAENDTATGGQGGIGLSALGGDGGLGFSAGGNGGDGIDAFGGMGGAATGNGGTAIRALGGGGAASGNGGDAIFAQGGSLGATGGHGIIAHGGSGVTTGGTGIFAQGGSGPSPGNAGDFSGNVTITGNINITGSLTKGSGAFRIDHPEDPAHKYLSHSFVESPDMMNIYNGNVVLDVKGTAWVQLPGWFEKLNGDFRYQLTAIGAPGRGLYIAEEISNNRFKIAGGKPGGKVSWTVTGIRQDPYAKAHPIVVEEIKPEAEQNTYLHPELYGQPEQRSVTYMKLRDASSAVR